MKTPLRKQLEEWFAALLIISGHLPLLVTLAWIAVCDDVRIYEPRPWILGLELAWCAGAVIFGLGRTWKARPGKNRERVSGKTRAVRGPTIRF